MITKTLKVIPLGGLGEIGKNMMVFEYGDDIVVVDCGVLFPEADMPGIDLVLPDIRYLIENRRKIRAILITHGHEDHTGAIPYVLSQINVPVFAPRLAHGLISVKLKEHNLDKQTELNQIEPGVTYKFGSFGIEFFRVCHSIPDAMGIAIDTPIGKVIHTGDFKIDHTPVDGKPTDLASLARLGSDGVMLLLSDSTYAEMQGYTPSEQVVKEAIFRAIGEAKGRVLVASFASLISRIQHDIEAAVYHHRKITFVGRSMVNNVAMAEEMGYISAPAGTIVPLQEAINLPSERLVMMTTGSQGEPTSALVRIANGTHRDIKIEIDDTVIISATPIPGNERVVSRTINNLVRKGANVLYDKIALVHVHGHSSQEELKLVLNLVKPRYFVPIHGEYKGLVAHANLAENTGVHQGNIFVLEDGDVLELNGSEAWIAGQVQAGQVFLDGSSTIDMESPALRERKALSRAGIVLVISIIDGKNDRLVSDVEIVGSGFVDSDKLCFISRMVSPVLSESWDSGDFLASDLAKTNKKIKRIVSDILYKETGKRPMIVPVILQV